MRSLADGDEAQAGLPGLCAPIRPRYERDAVTTVLELAQPLCVPRD